MKRFLLDTHVWLRIANNNAVFSKELRQKIDHAAKQGTLFIADITLWEVAMLEAKRRLQLTTNCLQWLKQAINLTAVEVLHLNSEIAVESCNLPENFHQDPADRIIVATARIHDLYLVTADQAILQYGKQHCVKTIEV